MRYRVQIDIENDNLIRVVDMLDYHLIATFHDKDAKKLAEEYAEFKNSKSTTPFCNLYANDGRIINTFFGEDCKDKADKYVINYNLASEMLKCLEDNIVGSPTTNESYR